MDDHLVNDKEKLEFSKRADFEAKIEFSKGKSSTKIPQNRFKLQWDSLENFGDAVLKRNLSHLPKDHLNAKADISTQAEILKEFVALAGRTADDLRARLRTLFIPALSGTIVLAQKAQNSMPETFDKIRSQLFWTSRTHPQRSSTYA